MPDHLKNITVHDALIKIVLYFCITSEAYYGYHHTIDKTLGIAEKRPLFDEGSEDILGRIIKCISLF